MTFELNVKFLFVVLVCKMYLNKMENLLWKTGVFVNLDKRNVHLFLTRYKLMMWLFNGLKWSNVLPFRESFS